MCMISLETQWRIFKKEENFYQKIKKSVERYQILVTKKVTYMVFGHKMLLTPCVSGSINYRISAELVFFESLKYRKFK